MVGAPMGRAPIVVRGLVLVSMSVLLGVIAHLTSGGMGLRFGPLMVTVCLVSITVTSVVAAGAWLGARLPRARWRSHAEDAAAALALVLGQVLVHLLGSPVPVTLNLPTASAHLSHHGSLDAGDLAAHTGHGMHASLPMALAHVTAALVLGVALRWLEASVLRLSEVLGVTVRALGAVVALGVLRAPGPVLGVRARMWAPCWEVDEHPTVRRVLGTAVVRRGPPMGLAHT